MNFEWLCEMMECLVVFVIVLNLYIGYKCVIVVVVEVYVIGKLICEVVLVCELMIVV